MQKLLIISGPTATGKTKVALHLAHKYNGELVSADSRQVYKGLDVLTGKDLPAGVKCHVSSVRKKFRSKIYSLPMYLIDDIPVWMYDVVLPHEVFSVAHFYALASEVIADITRRGKLPILVGGTGLYIRSLVYPIETLDVPQNKTQRKNLSTVSVSQMQEMLQQEDMGKWQKMNESDRNNPRRLVRALEVAQWKKTHCITAQEIPRYDLLWIGLQAELNMLKEKIESRVIARIDGGVLTEVEQYSVKDTQLPAITSLGIALARRYLDKTLTREELIGLWTREELSYAKRQMTWFHKESDVRWFDIGDPDMRQKVEEIVVGWYTGSHGIQSGNFI